MLGQGKNTRNDVKRRREHMRRRRRKLTELGQRNMKEYK